MRHDGSDAEAWRTQGRALLALGDSAAALSSLERAVELQPGSPDAWYWLARAARVAERLDRLASARARLEALDDDLAADLNSVEGVPGR